MKILLLTFFLSQSLIASYGPPSVMARFCGPDEFNAPKGLCCFSSTPLPTDHGVLLGCFNDEGQSQMLRFDSSFEVMATSVHGYFSHPKIMNDRTSWHEFNEAGITKLYEFEKNKLRTIKLKSLGPAWALIDAFSPIKNESYIYRVQDEAKYLFTWKDHKVSPLFTQEVSYIFPPITSAQGDVVFKIRTIGLGDNSPDELMIWNGKLSSLLKDQDADPSSFIKAFRHQMALDQETLALILTDHLGEALYLYDYQLKKMNLVARAGVHLISFDYFPPHLRNGVLAFRGVDLHGKKALWAHKDGELKKILTQGDIILTDNGPAKVDYTSQDAIFYGAPGISNKGEIFQQATLSSLDNREKVFGIGLLKFKHE